MISRSHLFLLSVTTALIYSSNSFAQVNFEDTGTINNGGTFNGIRTKSKIETLNNLKSGVIDGADGRGITVDGVGATIGTINNYGKIIGTSYSVNAGSGTITNFNNYGLLKGDVFLMHGSLNLLQSANAITANSTVHGEIYGDTGSAINIGNDTTPTVFSAVYNASVDHINIARGSKLNLGLLQNWEAYSDVNNNGTVAVSGNGASYVTATLTVGGAFINNGTIDLLNQSGIGDTITIAGNYVGNNGKIILGSVLDGDGSKTDRIDIQGDTSGSTLVTVVNQGGLGALTKEGIEIITVGGTSEGKFSLDGEYIIVGAYTYRLHKNNASGTDPNDWYLRSAVRNPETDMPKTESDQNSNSYPVTIIPEYHRGAPVYETYAKALLSLNSVSSHRERTGSRVWSGAGNRMIAEGADASDGPYSKFEESGSAIGSNGIWARVEGTHNRIRPNVSLTGTDYTLNSMKLQAGFDGKVYENGEGSLIAGAFVQYVHGKTKTSASYYANGEISTDGYGLGGTLTWIGNNGLYFDGQAQVTWYNSDLSVDEIGIPALAIDNNGMGYALSAETGQRIDLDPNWSITPNGQLVYSSIDFNSVRDLYNANVRLERGSSFQGILGATLEHQTSWQNGNGFMNRASVYGLANLSYEFLNGTKVNVTDVSFVSTNDRLWGSVGAGGNYSWDNDKYSVFGEGALQTSLNNFGDSYSLKAKVGFRSTW